MAATPFVEAGGGASWWQTLGGLLAVFALLVVSLKLLGKFNRRRGGGQASLITVWHLGPRREIQILGVGDQVHHIYRHDGAMVLLKQESRTEWERSLAASEATTGRTSDGRNFLERLPMAALPDLLRRPASAPGTESR